MLKMLTSPVRAFHGHESRKNWLIPEKSGDTFFFRQKLLKRLFQVDYTLLQLR